MSNNYIVIPQNIIFDLMIPHVCLRVFALISSFNQDGNTHIPDMYISTSLGISKAQVSRSIRHLKEKGYIIIKRENKERKIEILSQKGITVITDGINTVDIPSALKTFWEMWGAKKC